MTSNIKQPTSTSSEKVSEREVAEDEEDLRILLTASYLQAESSKEGSEPLPKADTGGIPVQPLRPSMEKAASSPASVGSATPHTSQAPGSAPTPRRIQKRRKLISFKNGWRRTWNGLLHVGRGLRDHQPSVNRRGRSADHLPESLGLPKGKEKTEEELARNNQFDVHAEDDDDNDDDPNKKSGPAKILEEGTARQCGEGECWSEEEVEWCGMRYAKGDLPPFDTTGFRGTLPKLGWIRTLALNVDMSAHHGILCV